MKKIFGGGLAALALFIALAYSIAPRYVAVSATLPPPLCFTNAAGVLVCNVPGYGPSPAAQSPNPLASVATGGTAYVYQTLQSFPVTCGFAPSGTCIVIFNGDLNYQGAVGATTGFLSPCLAVSSTPSPLPVTLAATYPAATTAPCASSAPANPLAGAPSFAMSTASPLPINSLTSHVAWTGTIPVNTSLTLLLEVEASSGTTETVYGSGSAIVLPF